jgi:hypothetical protein
MNAPRRPPAIFARPLAEYALRQIDPLVARQGFGETALILRWPEIVGERIAALCAPERLQWPPRPRRKTDGPSTGDGKKTRVNHARDREPATLILRVEPGFGLDIQHMAQTIIDRVNAHLGWRCVGRIVQRQGAIGTSPRVRNPASRPPPPSCDPAARARAEAVVAGIADPALQAVLLRLGENALRRPTVTGGQTSPV